MQKKTTLLIIILCFLANLSKAQRNSTSEKKLNILTLGDSNGTFPHSWPKQLGQALPYAQIFNLSKSGRTIGFLNLGDSSLNSLMVIDQNLKKAAEFTGQRPFDFIILELGTNDAKAVFADRQNEVAYSFEKLINSIKHSTYNVISQAKIIVISPPPYGLKAEETEKYKGGDARVKEMNKTFRKIAAKTDCLFVSGYDTPGLDINTMTEDGLHLNATASHKLIEPVLSVMLENK